MVTRLVNFGLAALTESLNYHGIQPRELLLAEERLRKAKKAGIDDLGE